MIFKGIFWFVIFCLIFVINIKGALGGSSPSGSCSGCVPGFTDTLQQQINMIKVSQTHKQHRSQPMFLQWLWNSCLCSYLSQWNSNLTTLSLAKYYSRSMTRPNCKLVAWCDPLWGITSTVFYPHANGILAYALNNTSFIHTKRW